MPLAEVFDYFKHYDKQSFVVVAGQGNEPTEADVAAFEAQAGFRLPDEFRKFTTSSLGDLHNARGAVVPRRSGPYAAA